MNVLYIPLFLVLIQHVFASKRKGHEQGTSLVPEKRRIRIKDLTPIQRFEMELRKKKMAPASRIYESGDDQFKRLCTQHLVSLGSDRLVGLINGTTQDYKPWALSALLLHADTPFIGAVFDKLNGDAYTVFSAAEYVADLAFMHRSFLY